MRRCFLIPAFMATTLSACSSGGGADVSAARSFLASASLTIPATNVGTVDGIVETSAGMVDMTEMARMSAPTTTYKDRRFKRLLNRTRKAAGVGRVTYNRKLNRAAQRHARDMVRKDYFSHTGRDGSDVGERVARTGYRAVAYGENLGMGQQSDREIRKGWVKSPPHYDMMTAKSLKQFGLGVAGRGANTRWVLVMGARK